MRAEDSADPAAWFSRCDDDVLAAGILSANDGPVAVVGFHVQQAVEKSLKGYLLSRGVPLRRTHDIEFLLSDAIGIIPELEAWSEL